MSEERDEWGYTPTDKENAAKLEHRHKPDLKCSQCGRPIPLGAIYDEFFERDELKGNLCSKQCVLKWTKKYDLEHGTNSIAVIYDAQRHLALPLGLNSIEIKKDEKTR